MKKIISIIVIVAVAVGLFFALKDQICAKAPADAALQTLLQRVPKSPALVIGITQDQATTQELKQSADWLALEKAFTGNPVIKAKIQEFLDEAAKEYPKFAALIDREDPLGALKHFATDNFLALLVYIPNIEVKDGKTPDFLCALSLKNASKLSQLFSESENLKPCQISGKNAYEGDGIYLLADDNLVLCSNAPKEMERFVNATTKDKESVLDNPRFQKLAVHTPGYVSMIFGDTDTYKFDMDPEDRANWEKVDKVFGFSAIKAFGFFGKNLNLYEGLGSFNLLFEGDSLLYRLAEQANLPKNELLKHALSNSDYALELAIPTLDAKALEELGTLSDDPLQYKEIVESDIFRAINGNLTSVQLSIANLKQILQRQVPDILLIANFKDLSTFTGLPLLQKVLESPFLTKKSDQDGTVYSAGPIPPIGLKTIDVICLKSNKLAISTLKDKKSALDLAKGSGASLADNAVVSALNGSLDKGGFLRSYENYAEIIKLQLESQFKDIAAAQALMDDMCPPEMLANEQLLATQKTLLDILNQVLERMDIVCSAKAQDGIIRCDAIGKSKINLDALAKVLENIGKKK